MGACAWLVRLLCLFEKERGEPAFARCCTRGAGAPASSLGLGGRSGHRPHSCMGADGAGAARFHTYRKGSWTPVHGGRGPGDIQTSASRALSRVVLGAHTLPSLAR